MSRKKISAKNNYQFIDNALINNISFMHYINSFTRIAISRFEWLNLPDSMNARYLELSLCYFGMAALLKDEKYGFINTKCTSGGYLNIYGLPTKLNCYSYDYSTTRTLYTGLKPRSEAQREAMEKNECILVMNDIDMLPTMSALELFAYRLYEAERTCDVNIKAQKTPVLLLVDETQRALMENLYSQYDGNRPMIFGDKNQLSPDVLRAINTQAPYVADKIQEYKKEIWNEALTFLGVNNLLTDKKERLIQDEANANNELINFNLQAYLAPRQEACKQFNEKFNLTGTNKEISVRLRSDLHNVIKNEMSIINDIRNTQKEDIENG